MKIFKYFMNLAILLCLVQSMTFADIKNNDILYNQLITEIRCMVCQNQSIDDSSSSIARDLRILIRSKIEEGKEDKEVYKFLTERYGDFILLKPPLKNNTIALWFLPFVFFIIGIFIILNHNKKSNKFIRKN